MRQHAERLSLNEYRIDAPSGGVQTEIRLQSGLFTARSAPLSPSIDALGIADAPTVTVEGRPYRMFKVLLGDRVFANHFDLGLQGPDAAAGPAITAHYGDRDWNTTIQHAGCDYLLRPRAWFSFKFDLAQGDEVVARFSDVTPFLNLSARRTYQIDSGSEQPAPLLLAFAFLLALSSTYRLAL